MKILIVVSHPTQFEAPFFQFVSQIRPSLIEVLYTDNQKLEKIFDKEINRNISWGIDLLSKYDYCVLPAENWKMWLINKFKNGKFDLVIVNGYYKNSLIFSAILAKVFRSRVALRLDSVAFTDGRAKKLMKWILFKPLSIFFDHFFIVGTLTKRYVQWLGVPDRKISTFSYVTDNAYFISNSSQARKQKGELKRLYNIDGTSKVVLAVSKLNKRETPWDLLKAAKKIRGNLHILLVGDGQEMPELKKFAQENPQIKISFAGYVRYPDLPMHYSIADLFVHAPDSEPWGVSVQEAMASGLPVITSSRVGASYDLISEGMNGFIYKANDPDDLAKKIETILYKTSNRTIKRANDSILGVWNYATTFDNILNVALHRR